MMHEIIESSESRLKGVIMFKSKNQCLLVIGVAFLVLMAAGSAAQPDRENRGAGIKQVFQLNDKNLEGVYWHVLNHPETKCLLNPLINPELVTIPDNATGCLASAFGGTKVWWFGEDSRGSYLGVGAPLPQPPKDGGISATAISGNLTSPAFSPVPNGSRLVFMSWWEIEADSPASFDLMSISAGIDEANFVELARLNPVNYTFWGTPDLHYASGYSGIGAPAVSSDPFKAPAWTNYTIALPEGATNIRFKFDTRDTIYNGFRGWMLDNIKVVDGNGTIIFSDDVEQGQGNWVAEPALPSIVDINVVKFHDTNGNGIQDSDESRLSGWNFTVKDKNSNTVCAGMTDVNGNLTCPPINTSSNPPPYTIAEVLQAGWINTVPNPRVISPLISSVNVSFGNALPGGIQGMKWDDRNGNGIRDIGEPGIENISICYFNESGFGDVCTVTGSDGSYSFMDIAPGFYTLFENVPAGKVQTFPRFDHIFNLKSGEIKKGINFGNANASEIHGVKFNDTNGNGIKDAGESGIGNWRIRLESLDIAAQIRIIRITYTEANGSYSFKELAPGFYKVSEEDRPGWRPSGMPTRVVRLSQNQTVDVDFGNIRIIPESCNTSIIYGYKFNDTNGDGIFNAGNESGLANRTIKLSGFDSCTRRFVDTSTITDVTGYFEFRDVAAGKYTLMEVLSPGWIITTPGNLTVSVPSVSTMIRKDLGNRRI